MTNDDSTRLIERLRAGESAAEKDFMNRYLRRLVALAQTKMSPGLRARVDAQDPVQSALASFCLRLRDGRLTAQDDDVWNLLAQITLNKVRRTAVFHRAKKRDINAEEFFTSSNGLMTISYAAIAQDPSVEDVVVCEELIEEVLDRFDKTEQQMIKLRLQGYQIKEIAEEVSRSIPTVRNVLRKVKDFLKRRAGSE